MRDLIASPKVLLSLPLIIIQILPEPFKTKATLQPSNCTTRYFSKGYKHSDLKGHLHPNVNISKSPIAKLWKEPRCPLADEWIKKMWHIHTIEYYSGIKKNELLPFAMTWMELEGILLSEISQSEKDNYHDFTHMWKLRNKTDEHRGREGKKKDENRDGGRP